MKNILRTLWHNQHIKKTIGVFLIIFGFIGLVTPFTPWGILFFIGLELLGIRILWIEKLKQKLIHLKEEYKKTN